MALSCGCVMARQTALQLHSKQIRQAAGAAQAQMQKYRNGTLTTVQSEWLFEQRHPCSDTFIIVFNHKRCKHNQQEQCLQETVMLDAFKSPNKMLLIITRVLPSSNSSLLVLHSSCTLTVIPFPRTLKLPRSSARQVFLCCFSGAYACSPELPSERGVSWMPP